MLRIRDGREGGRPWIAEERHGASCSRPGQAAAREDNGCNFAAARVAVESARAIAVGPILLASRYTAELRS